MGQNERPRNANVLLCPRHNACLRPSKMPPSRSSWTRRDLRSSPCRGNGSLGRPELRNVPLPAATKTLEAGTSMLGCLRCRFYGWLPRSRRLPGQSLTWSPLSKPCIRVLADMCVFWPCPKVRLLEWNLIWRKPAGITANSGAGSYHEGFSRRWAVPYYATDGYDETSYLQ